MKYYNKSSFTNLAVCCLVLECLFNSLTTTTPLPKLSVHLPAEPWFSSSKFSEEPMGWVTQVFLWAEGKSTNWPQPRKISHWPYPFFIHHRTLEGKCCSLYAGSLKPIFITDIILHRISHCTKQNVHKLEQVGKYLWGKVHNIVKACKVWIVYNCK